LATSKALVDVEGGELKFRINEEEVSFNICMIMKYPSDLHMVSHLDQINEAVASIGEAKYSGNILVAVLLKYDEKEISDYDEFVSTLVGLRSYTSNPKKLDIDLSSREEPRPHNPS